jgi:hypothetical protein
MNQRPNMYNVRNGICRVLTWVGIGRVIVIIIQTVEAVVFSSYIRCHIDIIMNYLWLKLVQIYSRWGNVQPLVGNKDKTPNISGAHFKALNWVLSDYEISHHF